MIRIILAVMAFTLVAFLPASADTRDVYTITDIRVDQRAGSVIAAREKAMASARVRGARALINKITLEADRSRVGGVPIDGALASKLTAAVDVQEEVAGAGRYRGTLSVVLNPRTVRAHLDSLGVPYSDRQGPVGLIVPVAQGGLAGPWKAAFGERNSRALSPYVTSAVPSSTRVSWNDIQSEVATTRASRGVMAELMGRDGSYSVRLSSVTSGGSTQIGTTSPQPSLAAAARAAIAKLGEDWKRQSIIRGNSSQTLQYATVRYTSLAEWNTLRGALARSPMISEFETEAIARDGSVVKFAFAGDRSRLTQDLRQRGVTIDYNRGGWVLRSAISR